MLRFKKKKDPKVTNVLERAKNIVNVIPNF